jgi:subtilisin family serine protease
MKTRHSFFANSLAVMFALVSLVPATPLAFGGRPDAAPQEKTRNVGSRAVQDQPGKNWKRPPSKLIHKPEGIKAQYIVVLDDAVVGPPGDGSAAEEIADALVATYGGKIRHKFAHALNGFSVRMREEEALAMSQDPAVAWIEQDSEMKGSAVQGYATWGLDRIDQRSLPLDATFSFDYTGAGVLVFVIDSGIMTSHPEFGGRAYVLADFVGDGWNGQDCFGHGTHVAGTIGGRTFGVAKDAVLLSVRVLGCDNDGSIDGIIAAVNLVTQYHPNPAVVNMSLGGGMNWALDYAVNNSVASGVTYVVSAGNDNIDACYASPARAEGAISVGATNRFDARWVDSPWAGSNYGPCVDIFAPGAQITSAYPYGTGVATLNGTSMASPHVTGAVAALLSAYPWLSPSTVRSVILNNATPFWTWNIGYGSPNRLLYSPLQ